MDWNLFLRDPLDAIHHATRPRCDSVSCASEISELWKPITTEIAEKLGKDSSLLQQIPVLQLHAAEQIRPGSLVRFMGMVEDMGEPEYYPAAVKCDSTVHLCRYVDVLPPNVDPGHEMDMSLTAERRPVMCSELPACTEWFQNELNRSAGTAKHDRPADVSSTRNPKRPRDATASEAVEVDAKQSKHQASAASEGGSPSGDTERKCVVTLYEDMDALKICDAREFVGILQCDPMEHDDHMDTSLYSSQFIRLHCIAALPVKVNDRNTGLRYLDPLSTPSQSSCVNSRSNFLKSVSAACFDDEVAAEALLLALISRVHTRSEGIPPLGKFAVNIFGEKNVVTATHGAVMTILTNVLTRMKTLDVTVSELNKHPWIPRKDFERNRIVTSDLQLSAGTVLSLNEINMEPGQLVDTGVRNVQLLQHILGQQILPIDFTYSTVDIPVDIPCVSFSTSKSFLPFDLYIRLEPTSDTQQPPSLSAMDLVELRHYLANISFLAVEPLSDELQQHVESFFVDARKADPKLSPENIHLWLSTARSVALSMGSRVIERAHFDHAVEFLKKCNARA